MRQAEPMLTFRSRRSTVGLVGARSNWEEMRFSPSLLSAETWRCEEEREFQELRSKSMEHFKDFGETWGR